MPGGLRAFQALGKDGTFAVHRLRDECRIAHQALGGAQGTDRLLGQRVRHRQRLGVQRLRRHQMLRQTPFDGVLPSTGSPSANRL